MKTYKVIRIWRVQANNKWQAMELFRSLEEAGKADDYLDVQFAAEEKPQGWWGAIKKQIIG